MTAKIMPFPARPRPTVASTPIALRHWINHHAYAQSYQRAAWNRWWSGSDIWSDEHRIERQRESAALYAKAREHADAWLRGEA